MVNNGMSQKLDLVVLSRRRFREGKETISKNYRKTIEKESSELSFQKGKKKRMGHFMHHWALWSHPSWKMRGRRKRKYKGKKMNKRDFKKRHHHESSSTCVWYTLIIFICALLLQRKSCTVYLYWCHILWTIMLVYWYRDFYYYTKDSKNTSCAMDIRDY